MANSQMLSVTVIILEIFLAVCNLALDSFSTCMLISKMSLCIGHSAIFGPVLSWTYLMKTSSLSLIVGFYTVFSPISAE